MIFCLSLFLSSASAEPSGFTPPETIQGMVKQGDILKARGTVKAFSCRDAVAEAMAKLERKAQQNGLQLLQVTDQGSEGHASVDIGCEAVGKKKTAAHVRGVAARISNTGAFAGRQMPLEEALAYADRLDHATYLDDVNGQIYLTFHHTATNEEYTPNTMPAQRAALAYSNFVSGLLQRDLQEAEAFTDVVVGVALVIHRVRVTEAPSWENFTYLMTLEQLSAAASLTQTHSQTLSTIRILRQEETSFDQGALTAVQADVSVLGDH